MALRYELKSVGKDGTGLVAYVNLVDADSGALLRKACVPYDGTQASLIAAIETKFAAAVDAHREAVGEKQKLAQAIASLDPERPTTRREEP